MPYFMLNIFVDAFYALTQGRRKRFTTGPAKRDPSTIQLNAWAANNFTTSHILFLLVIVYCCKSNRSKNHTAMVFIT